MRDLIERLRLGASISRDRNLNLDFAKVADDAADALERLTAGDIELPEPTIEFMSGHREPFAVYDPADIKDYGDRRASAVLAERELMDIQTEPVALGSNEGLDPLVKTAWRGPNWSHSADDKRSFFSRDLLEKAIMTTADEALVRQRTCPNCGATLRSHQDDYTEAHGMKFSACEDCERLFVLAANVAPSNVEVEPPNTAPRC